jgi:inorganic pyrophosphatase
MRVLIENEAGLRIKNTYDERTLRLVGTAEVSAAYPFAYGFVIGTRAGDGDAADCFVISERKLASGATVDCEPLALLEQIEDGEIDHKLITVPRGETAVIDESIVGAIRQFAANVFSHVAGKRMVIGRLLDKRAAEDYLRRCGESG